MFFLLVGGVATYGGVFVVTSIVWGMVVDKKRPDRYELVGVVVVLMGVLVIFVPLTLQGTMMDQVTHNRFQQLHSPFSGAAPLI